MEKCPQCQVGLRQQQKMIIKSLFHTCLVFLVLMRQVLFLLKKSELRCFQPFFVCMGFHSMSNEVTTFTRQQGYNDYSKLLQSRRQLTRICSNFLITTTLSATTASERDKQKEPILSTKSGLQRHISVSVSIVSRCFTPSQPIQLYLLSS